MDYNNQQNPQQYNSQPYGTYNRNTIPEEYKPITMWGYFGYQLLFAIPCVGLILLLVFSFGGTKNINLRNYARSYFCLLLLGTIISLILFFAVGGTAMLSSM